MNEGRKARRRRRKGGGRKRWGGLRGRESDKEGKKGERR